MALLELRNVSKTYESDAGRVAALDDISLNVNAGEFVALVGRSGCGKSTLLNLAGAIDYPTSGTVSVDGAATTELNDSALTRLRREKIGFIFQSFQLLQNLSVIENTELPLLLAKHAGARCAAEERLSWVGLQDTGARLPHQLSGGQQQRVAIARALVHNPRLILADEPTGNLDTSTGEAITKLLRRAADEFHAAVVMATHSAEAAASANRIVRLRDGRLAE